MEKIDVFRSLDREDLIEQIVQIGERNHLSPLEMNIIETKYLDKIQGFYESELGQRLRRSKDVKKEAPFVIKKKAKEISRTMDQEDYILIQGIIDCYFEEDGQIVIVDYKTDGANEGNIEEIKSAHKDQINIYKEAIEKTGKKKVKEAFIYLFSIGKIIKMD